MREGFSKSKILDLPPINSHFEELFERGIDPSLHDDKEILHDNSVERVKKNMGVDFTWPSWQELEAYEEEVNTNFTAAVRKVLKIADESSKEEEERERQKENTLHILKLIIDHDCMHHETLCYMLRNLRPIHKHWNRWVHNDFRRALPVVKIVAPSAFGEKLRWVNVTESTVIYGTGRDKPLKDVLNRLQFTWDCEQTWRAIRMALHTSYRASKYLRFPQQSNNLKHLFLDGGYKRERYWQPEHWAYIQKEGIARPAGWNSDDTVQYLVRTVPL